MDTKKLPDVTLNLPITLAKVSTSCTHMQLAMHDRQYSAIKNNVSSNACGNRLPHRRRKILKVGGLKICLSARSAREKFQTTPILGQTAPICERSTLLRLDFLHKRTNGKSSRADLAAT